MSRTAAILAAALGLLEGCNSGLPTTGECAAPNSIAIVLTVTDSVSGDSIADSASGTVTAGAYSDSLHHYLGFPALLAGGDQLGTYAVTVARPGYAPWGRTGVAVTHKGVCGNVEPVVLQARLHPSP
jgi:hypothetical protein